MTLDELRERLTIPLWPDTAEILGIAKNTAYAAAKAGEIPVIRLGQRYIVSVPALLKLLQADDLSTTEVTPSEGVQSSHPLAAQDVGNPDTPQRLHAA